MKYIIINIVLFALLLGNVTKISCKPLSIEFNASAHEYVRQAQQDTLKYLHDNIIAHKDRYQNKKLNEIIKHLNIQIKSYNFAFSYQSKDLISSITLFFETPTSINQKLQNRHAVPMLVIFFKDPIPMRTAIILSVKDKRVWTKDAEDYYGNLIVKDLMGLRREVPHISRMTIYPPTH